MGGHFTACWWFRCRGKGLPKAHLGGRRLEATPLGLLAEELALKSGELLLELCNASLELGTLGSPVERRIGGCSSGE